jgi:uncharacterized membrane protein
MPNDIRVYSAGPLTIVALIAIIGLLVIIVPLLFLGLVGKALTNLVGLSWLTATALVILILLCSLVNLPVWKVRRETIRMPHNETPDEFTLNENGGLWETTILVNLGGAIIPFAMACWLLYRASAVTNGNTLYLQVLAATLIVASMAYVTTRPMVGIGLRVPLFIPGLTALLCGILLAGGFGLLSAGVIAFVSATFGILIGANIAHLPHVGDLEVYQVSIGGAGTFGAIFIGCILSAIIA